VQKERQPNVINCKMMEHDRWAKDFATCNTIKRFQELIKIVQFYFNLWSLYANMERFFPCYSHKAIRKRNLISG